MIESQRLGLRNLKLSDIDDLYNILSDPETMKYYPKTYSKAETKNWISKSMKSYIENGFGLWAIILKSNNQFIGQCGITLQNIDDEIVPEIGYHINKIHWNQGFGTEAAYLCLNYGFSILKLKEIYIHTSLKNTPSRRVAEKIGMVKIKEYDKQVNRSGMIDRHIVYSLKNQQYQR